MTADFRTRAKEIFWEAADLPTGERAPLLDARCAGDAGLRELVESLLLADKATVLSPRLGRGGDAEDAVGTEIGPYRITSVIGEGGFGTVYLAEQQRPFRRRVAVKVIKAGMDTRQVVARFEAERQVLALMEHPNIARVHDAGATPQGRPYFVMEYVPGVPLTRFCDEQQLSIDARLALFLEVCGAIHHAHQKGVIHRDIKPSNILVEIIDSRPVPKVIDFGIAKAAAGGLSGEGPRTERGGVLGTPEYMSPEQADMGGVDVDTRTDVYSLGVVLYELLTGVPPLDPRAVRLGPAAELARRLRDLPTVRPSTRLRMLSASRSAGTDRSGDRYHCGAGGSSAPTAVATETAAPGGPGPDPLEIAARRACDLPALRRRLRGDLDWVLLRAMEKDRDRRYASASEFAADIERHLDGHAVVARPPSTAYLARKFVRRHRAAAAATALVAVILIAATAVSVLMAVREATHRHAAERDRTAAERSRAEARLQSYEANLAAAAVALDHGDYPLAERSLGAAPEELRGWEWRALSWQADRSLFRLSGHAGAMHGLLSRDGATLWTVDTVGDLRQWNLADGTLLRRVRIAPCDGLTGVSADGAVLVTWLRPGTITGWDTSAGRFLWTLSGYEQRLGGPHPDGAHLLVLSGDDGTIRPLDMATGELGSALWKPAGPAGHPQCSANGRWLLLASPNEVATIVDLEQGEVRWTHPSLGGMFDAAGDRVHVFTPLTPMTAEHRTVDCGTGEVAPSLFAPMSVTVSNPISPDGRYVVSTGTSGTVSVWDEHSAQPRPLYRHAGGAPWTLVTPDSRLVVTGGADGCVRVWDIRTGDCESTIHHDWFPGGPPAAANAPMDAVVSTGWGTVMLWDGATGALRWGRTVSRHVMHGAAFADEAGVVAAIDAQGRLFLLEAGSGEQVGSADIVVGVNARSMAITPDAAHFVIATADTAAIVDLRTRPVTTTVVPLDGRPRALATSPDGTRLAVVVRHGGGRHTLRGFSLPHGAPAWEASLGEAEPGRLAFHPHEGTLAVALANGDVVVFDQSGAAVRTIALAAPSLLCLAFHPTEPLLAAGSDDGLLHLLRLDVGRAAVVLRSPTRQAIHAAVFSPDGATLTLADRLSSVTSLAERSPPAGFGPRFASSRAQTALARAVLAGGAQLGVDAAQRIDEDRSLPEDVREEALRQARAFSPPANTLNSLAWGAVRTPGREREQYMRALAAVRAALTVFPDDASILNTYGLALYRVGRLEEAAHALTRSDAISVQSGRGELPYNAAALAMALHGQGRVREALQALEQTRRLAAEPPYAQDWEVRLLLHEAEETLAKPRPRGE